MQHYPSDVTRLLACIDAEYTAAKRGLSGIASSTAQHQFITTKMERIEQLHQELRSHVGEKAIALIAQVIDSSHDERPASSHNHEP